MSETNYNETIIIPFLQKKCQDLSNTNLVFEANLSVEQAKSNDSSTYFKLATSINFSSLYFLL